jgi:glyoxylase-like metal-dependent hydrolase (beta-lactamase superfamily II)
MNTVTTFTSFTTSNCYIVKPYNDERCIFIDLPPDLENALEYVNKENLTIMGALITHGHFDHALGMEKFNYGKYLSLEDEFLARNPQEQIKMFMGDDTGVNEYKGEILDVEIPVIQREVFLTNFHN